MVEKIKFDISSDGEVSVNVDCVTGSQCEVLTRPFEDKLGLVVDKLYKDSYFQAEEHSDSLEQEKSSAE